MRRSAFLLIAALSAAAIAALAFTVVSLNNRHITAWVMAQDAGAGTQLGGPLVQQVTIPQGTDDFTVLATPPTGRYLAHSTSRGDVLGPDDLFRVAMVTVPLSLKSVAPGLQSGTAVDIYGPSTAAAAPTGQAVAPETAASAGSGPGVQMYGRGITFVSTGSASAVLVPAAYEGYWVDLSVSGIDLVAVTSSGVQVPHGQTYTLQEAEQMLAAIANGSAPPPAAAPGSGG